jgi:hypothetical protein
MNARTKDGMSILEDDEFNIRQSAPPQLACPAELPVTCNASLSGVGTELELAANTSTYLRNSCNDFEGILKYISYMSPVIDNWFTELWWGIRSRAHDNVIVIVALGMR